MDDAYHLNGLSALTGGQSHYSSQQQQHQQQHQQQQQHQHQHQHPQPTQGGSVRRYPEGAQESNTLPPINGSMQYPLYSHGGSVPGSMPGSMPQTPITPHTPIPSTSSAPP